MRENLILQTSDALHELIEALQLSDLGHWSEKLRGIGLLDMGVLYHAAMDPQAILGEIRQTMDIPHSTLTSAVNRLERFGLARRVISDKDKRSYGLALTAKGRRTHEEHMRVDARIAGLVLEALEDDEERQHFVAMLDKIARRLKAG